MSHSQLVAGVVVPGWASERWPGWFAPEIQPFVVEGLDSQDLAALPTPVVQAPCGDEVRDSFWTYDRGPRVWLTESEFMHLDQSLRTRLVRAQMRVHELIGTVLSAPDAVRAEARAQVDGHRFVWWPSLVARAGLDPIFDYIEADVPASRHRDVPRQVWKRAAALLPEAERLAGTMPEKSGPNCFAAVMAAAGVPEAEHEWMQVKPFADWLAARTRPGGRDSDPGTVLVWRDRQGDPVHAAVTLGEGWALNKASQAWSSPRFVWTVREVVNHSRRPGAHLQRQTLAG